MALPQTYRALRNRNYRIFLSGQAISLVGTWMQSVVQAWLVYRLTHSAQWLGLITFANQVPAFLFSPLAGIVADRMERRKLLLWVQLVQMTQAFALSALVFTGRIEPWHIAVLGAVLGAANAFELTARHALAYDLVGKDDLPSAISLNAIVVNGSRVAGPALGGVLLAVIGESGCFFLNGVSYLAVIYGLTVIGLSAAPAPALSHGPLLRELGEAFGYLWKTPRILRLMILASFASLVAFPFMVLLPVIAKTVLGGGPGSLAWLTSMAGLGAILGLLGPGVRFSGLSGRFCRGMGQTLLLQTLLAGLALMLLGTARTLPLSLVATFFLGYFLMTLFPRINTTIQQEVKNSLRGRVLSIYNMTFLGAVPLGSLLQGTLADRYGAPAVVLGAGALCALTAGSFFAGRGFRCFSKPQPLEIEK
ncbi:MAG: MFS transporter [Oligoflexia bacterium]|nr:MFS transporter [Oligoflexia bacterium]